MSIAEHVLALCGQLERDQNEIPDRLVVSPAVWEALLYAHQDEFRYDAHTNTPQLANLVVSRSMQLSTGFALFKGDKLLKAIL